MKKSEAIISEYDTSPAHDPIVGSQCTEAAEDGARRCEGAGIEFEEAGNKHSYK